jgi:phage head maturation protease
MTPITKRVAATIEPGDDPGSFEAIISTSALDRDGDVIPVESWVFGGHVPVNINHSPSVSDIVGSGAPFIEDGALRLRATFANTDQAQHIRSLVVDGHLTGCSVEFMKRPDGRNELVGVGLVNIPANPEARVLASKSVMDLDEFTRQLKAILAGEPVTKAAADSIGGSAMVTAIHDASVHLGAQCVVAPQEDYDDGADDGANKAAALRLRLKALSR